MNYRKIYDDFIANRKLNQPAFGTTVEIHHIIPRCHGGTDDPFNLIRLKPEDHFFAHLLLAKCTNDSKMWSTVFLMSGAFRNKFNMLLARRWYGISRDLRKDNNLYNWAHKDGTKYTTTCHHMGEITGLKTQQFSRVAKGDRPQTHGWYITDRFLEHPERRTNTINTLNKKQEKIRLKHIDGREFEGTTLEARDATGCSSVDLCLIKKGKVQSMHGWMLSDTILTEHAKLQQCPKKGHLYHEEHGHFFGTAKEFKEKIGESVDVFKSIVSGRQSSSKGWKVVTYQENFTRL
jgi:hypothetical protein